MARRKYDDLSQEQLVKLLEARGIGGMRCGLGWFGRRMRLSGIGH